MTKVNVHEAKSQLSKLIALAKKGEDVVIANNGNPEVRIVAYEKNQSDWFGMDAGKIWLSEDFDELDEDLLDIMNDPKIFPDEDASDGK